ncbi:SIFamide-related peptide [Aphidius gifuensis]|uniref:SIFamide-related peptide n=1 Tax=Aphidius gifuensis TaxID=684658 RepID=UPI001CDB740B|nr:SIFamide-related peptide [Aphidius gifuensis]
MSFVRVGLAIFIIALVACLSVEGGYRKPPFNGSIFGKRSGTMTEQDLTNLAIDIVDSEVMNRAMSSMCEMASETCNAWLLHQDSN